MHSFFSLFSLLCIPPSYFLPLFLHFSLITFFYFIAFLHFPFLLRLITFLLSPLSQLSSCISPVSQFTLLLTLFPLYNPDISFSHYSFHSTFQSFYSFFRSSFLYYLSYSYYGTKKSWFSLFAFTPTAWVLRDTAWMSYFSNAKLNLHRTAFQNILRISVWDKKEADFTNLQNFSFLALAPKNWKMP